MAAAWNRPIRFARACGGHSCVLDVAEEAKTHKIRRLVFSHLGRATLRAIDAGHKPPFGELGIEGRVYRVRAKA
jgi:hypothetical protein